MTLATAFGIRYAGEPLLVWLHMKDTAQAIHAFFFERSIIQWFTVAAFYFAMTMITARFTYYRSLRHSLETVSTIDFESIAIAPEEGHVSTPSHMKQANANPKNVSQGSNTAVKLAPLVRDRITGIKKCLRLHGLDATVWQAQELARRDEESMDEVYTLLTNVIQVMMALGFFGTVWGISRSMFGSFADLSSASPAHIRLGLSQFTAGLSTALDTTVMGLVGAITASLVVTVMRWAETGILNDLTDLVRTRFDLVAHSQKSLAPETDNAASVDASLASASVVVIPPTVAAQTQSA